MGMFDYISCDYPLPGDSADVQGWLFQTKDLDCWMDRYHIAENGDLFMVKESKSPVEYSGTIEFYMSNIVAGGPGSYTAAGEDMRGVTYVALFQDGKLIRITQTRNERDVSLPSSFLDQWRNREAYLPLTEALRKNPTPGVQAFRMTGTEEVPIPVTILHVGKRHLCIRQESDDASLGRAGDLAVCYRDLSQIYATAEEALASRKQRTDSWSQQQAAYDAAIAEKRAAREAGR